MLINLHILLITKQLSSVNCWTISDMNNFSNKIVYVIRKSLEFSFKIVWVITIVVSNPVIFLWMTANDVRALPADTRRHDLPPSCCWVHYPIFYTPIYFEAAYKTCSQTSSDNSIVQNMIMLLGQKITWKHHSNSVHKYLQPVQFLECDYAAS